MIMLVVCIAGNFQEVHKTWSVGHAKVAKALMLGFGTFIQ